MNYFFYKGTDPEYVRIMRNQMKLHPSLKTRQKITQKVEAMNRIQDYCRSDISTDYLTQELNRESNVAFYIEDEKQTTEIPGDSPWPALGAGRAQLQR